MYPVVYRLVKRGLASFPNNKKKKNMSVRKAVGFAQGRQHYEITGTRKRFPKERDNHILLKFDLQKSMVQCPLNSYVLTVN